jgi:hypothetical protein
MIPSLTGADRLVEPQMALAAIRQVLGDVVCVTKVSALQRHRASGRQVRD